MNEEMVFIFKLLNDDSIIGEATKEEQNGYYIKNPMMIQAETSRDGMRSNVFYPWCDFSDDTEIFIDRFHVLYVARPKARILTFYKKQVKSEEDSSLLESTAENDQELFTALLERMSSNTPLN